MRSCWRKKRDEIDMSKLQHNNGLMYMRACVRASVAKNLINKATKLFWLTLYMTLLNITTTDNYLCLSFLNGSTYIFTFRKTSCDETDLVR